jgi:aspartate/methionine/tyrosine aminotransferase
MPHKFSEYMNWAKLQSRLEFNLATSGVGPTSLRDLNLAIDELEINGDTRYGYAPLKTAIANKCGVEPDCVVTAAGASMANQLAMAALLESGDEVLIEEPGYEPVVAAALYLGADVKRFARSEENQYALDRDEIRRRMTPRTRLIVITNLHNPSGVLAPDSLLSEIGELAWSVGAHVLVDEVYLDAVYENTPQTALRLGSNFIVTNSLTKIYGVSGLRCGWILAQPALARTMWRLNDLFGVNAAHPADLISLAVFSQLDRVRDRWRAVVTADRAALGEFLAAHATLSAPATEWGTTAFVRLLSGAAEPFIQRLRDEYRTSVVPGRFFSMPDHFRIGMGVNSAKFREGLRRIDAALSVTAAT